MRVHLTGLKLDHCTKNENIHTVLEVSVVLKPRLVAKKGEFSTFTGSHLVKDAVPTITTKDRVCGL